MPPPPLPPDSIYTSCYCEENVYLLCRTFLETPSVVELWEIFAVFISNANKTVRHTRSGLSLRTGDN